VFPVILYRAVTVETLADRLGQELSCAPADPFAEDLVLTRSGAIQRWLAQRLSQQVGTSGHGDGICARIRFLTPSQFAAAIRPGPDPWSSDSLLPAVMVAVEQMGEMEEFSQVRTHLAEPHSRPRRRSTFARLTANRFSAYATWNLDMLASWNKGEWVAPDGSPIPSSQLWQPLLWNRVCENLGSTPAADCDLMGERARSAASHFSRIAVFCPDLIRPFDEMLLHALDAVQPVMAFSPLRADSADPDLARLSGRMSRQLAATTTALSRCQPEAETLVDQTRPTTLLHAVQQELALGEPHPATADDSIQIHAGYGDQQVEILADQLVSLLEENPHLEPRDILVLVHRMEDHHRLLEAFLHPEDSDQADPRHRIRASISSAEPENNTAADLLIFLMELVQGRATSEDLRRLCGFPLVMSHFGFTGADLDQVSTLISSSGIRWGLNAAQRGSQQMESFSQNTWMAGLGRMVLGVALSEEDLVYRGTVLPLDTVESDMVRLVEALGQIIAHVRQCCDTWVIPADPAQWAHRFRATLDCLTGTRWTATTLGKVVADFGRRPAVALNLAEAESTFDTIWKEQVWRSSFLNGDLGVAPLSEMSLVPHKVIVVFGLDADSFPHQPPSDGDDLASAWPTPDDPRARDHQIFNDAVMSAREKFIAVYAGFDPATAAPTPMPTPLVDVLALCDLCLPENTSADLVHVHSVVPGPARITARALPAVPLQAQVEPPAQVEIDDLCEMYANPAAYWLRRNAGLIPSVLKETDPGDTSIPIQLSALDKWQILTRMVSLLLAQKSPDAILQAELRRGTLPPGGMGTSLAQECLTQAQGIVTRAKRVLDQPLSWRTISLGGTSAPDLVGQISVHGTTIVSTGAGKVQPKQQISAWAKILSLQVAYPDEVWRAVLVGNRDTVTLTAPTADEAARHLDYLRLVHLKGLAAPLPLPPSAGAHLARFMARNLRPNMVEVERRLSDTWAREPAWGLIWPSFNQMTDEAPHSDEALPDESFTSRFRTLTHGIYVPVMRAGGVS